MQNYFYLFTDKPHLSQLVSMDNYIIYKFVDIYDSLLMNVVRVT